MESFFNDDDEDTLILFCFDSSCMLVEKFGLCVSVLSSLLGRLHAKGQKMTHPLTTISNIQTGQLAGQEPIQGGFALALVFFFWL